MNTGIISAIDVLTKREIEILLLISDGMVNDEISQHLGVSYQTVKNHIASIYRKLDLKNRTEAALFVYKHGLVNIREELEQRGSAVWQPHDELHNFIAWLESRGLSPGIIRSYRRPADAFLRWWEERRGEAFSKDLVDESDLDAYQIFIEKEFALSASRARSHMRAVHAVARWSSDAYIDEATMQSIAALAALDRYKTDLLSRSYSMTTARSYSLYVRSFAYWITNTYQRSFLHTDITWLKFSRFLSAKKASETTRKGYICALRDYSDWAVSNGLMDRVERGFLSAPYQSEYINSLEAGGLSPSVVKAYRYVVLTFYRWFVQAKLVELDEDSFSSEDLTAYLDYLHKVRGLKESTVLHHKSKVIRYLVWLGLCPQPFQSKPLITISDQVRTYLEKESEQLDDPLVARRAKALIRLAEGDTVLVVAKDLGVSRYSVYLWAQKLARKRPDDVGYHPKGRAENIPGR